MEHWQPRLETGRARPRQASRRISLVGWGVGLALSLGLWVAAYYLFV